MAFVSAGTWHGGVAAWQSNKRSVSTTTTTTRTPRASRAALRMQDSQDENGEQRKPEPYPGYYRDLAQSGVQNTQDDTKREVKVGGRKSLLRPDGRPYAPWMRVREEDLDVKPAEVKKSKSDAKGRLAGDPQQQELAGVGLRSRLLGDELELFWTTGDELGNKGFILQRRKGKSDKFEVIADYKTDPSALKSKGSNGGAYSYLCEKPEPGTWVYRVSDEDENGAVSDLSQTLVEIESEEDSQKQRIALIALVVLVVIAAAVGFLADPQSGL